MESHLNETSDYYLHAGDALGWELTVCNALHPEKSPCREILKRNLTYGDLLCDHLSCFVPMDAIERVIEIGGGYGYLMQALLTRNRHLRATMLDISPFLSRRQKDTLRDFEVETIVEDFLLTDPSRLQGKDLAILNENLGDFPTLINIPADVLVGPPDGLEGPFGRAREIFDRYALKRPETDSFNLNLGAIEVVEKLCASGIPYIFLSEHSCEAIVPEPYRDLIRISSSENPERIVLKGHCEYTIKFSHLEEVARTFDYLTHRGPLADFIEVEFDRKTRFITASKVVLEDEDEIIRYFVEDLYKYEYLILIRT